MCMHDLQMVELEETFITQLQRVADTYKREMQEQHSMRSDTEVRLRAAQLAVHQADTQREEALAALHALQVGTTAADTTIFLSAVRQIYSFETDIQFCMPSLVQIQLVLLSAIQSKLDPFLLQLSQAITIVYCHTC